MRAVRTLVVAAALAALALVAPAAAQAVQGHSAGHSKSFSKVVPDGWDW